jgi:hypothetical protein
MEYAPYHLALSEILVLVLDELGSSNLLQAAEQMAL